MDKWFYLMAFSRDPSIYAYLIDTSGEFTREKLKAFKSLEAYKLVKVFSYIELLCKIKLLLYLNNNKEMN